MSDVRRMQVGQVVDFVIDFNKRQEESERREKYEKKHGRTRKATQEDINAFFG